MVLHAYQRRYLRPFLEGLTRHAKQFLLLPTTFAVPNYVSPIHTVGGPVVDRFTRRANSSRPITRHYRVNAREVLRSRLFRSEQNGQPGDYAIFVSLVRPLSEAGRFVRVGGEM